MAEVGVDKSLLAFLNGISKRLYFGEDNITDEFLRDEVLQVPEEEYSMMLKKYTMLVNTLVTTDMDFTQLEAFLNSQMKKKQGSLSEQQAVTITRFWKMQKNKIHQRQIESSMWGSHLDSFSWRIDLKTKARHIEQLNEPTAIMEMKLKNECSRKGCEEEMVRFEVDSKKLAHLLSQVEDIQRSIDEHSHS